jgi:glycosyltransferase involved in cell wall biosynthesis
MRKLRLIIHTGAPWEPTGYGTQAALLGKWLAKQGHEVYYSARSGLMYQVAAYEGMPVLPGAPFYGAEWMDDMLPGHIVDITRSAGPVDAIIVLYDLWNFGITPDKLLGVPTLFWAAIDHERLGPKEYAYLNSGAIYPVAMSHFGKAVIEAGGFGCGYVPHSIETNKWVPLASLHTQVRDQFRVPHDKFVVGINGTATDMRRKMLYEQIRAFAGFHARHPGTVLMLHTLANFRWGANVNSMCRDAGLKVREGEPADDDAVIITPPYAYLRGLPGDTMVSWYNACDLVSNVSNEGFGLAAIEAQSCGTPVVLLDGSTGPELVGPGWLAKGQDVWNETHETRWQLPYIHSIQRCYEQAWKEWKAGGKAWRDRKHGAWQFASRYDWETVGPMWDTALAEAGVDLGED